MPSSMGRGLNIRFQLDSHVKIIANSSTLNWQDVCQMVGRSCRRFGMCKGTVYVKSGWPSIDLAGGKNYLNRDQDAYDVNEGQYIAQALFEKFPSIKNIEMRKEIVNLTDDPVVWRVTKAEFAKKNPNVLKFLTQEQYRPTSKW